MAAPAYGGTEPIFTAVELIHAGIKSADEALPVVVRSRSKYATSTCCLWISPMTAVMSEVLLDSRGEMMRILWPLYRSRKRSLVSA